jgi:hypothetical protein
MKRSEILSKLEIHLKELNAKENSYKIIAQLSLYIIEEAGMLPPTRRAENWEELGIDGANDSERPRFKLNKWDKE